ncbi:MAG TPA: MgtC/SapB family protein [Thermoleophilia bacterium]|nr:MgtC/SapB family protein [Thermoleophilia bacterium]
MRQDGHEVQQSRDGPGLDDGRLHPAVATIGTLCGAGLYLASLLTTGVVLTILELEWLPIGWRLDPKRLRRTKDEQRSDTD